MFGGLSRFVWFFLLFSVSHPKLLYIKIICHLQELDKVDLKFSSQIFSEILQFSSLKNAVYSMLWVA